MLILIDQLEELFSSTALSPESLEQFFQMLETLARSGRVWVLATVRSDFAHECQRVPALVRMKDGMNCLVPKLNSSFPSLRKHRASGQAVVTIASKDYYLGPHGSKTAQRAYDAKIAEWLASGRSSSLGIAQAELTIAELLNSYRKFAD